jgi:hypothetical protein
MRGSGATVAVWPTIRCAYSGLAREGRRLFRLSILPVLVAIAIGFGLPMLAVPMLIAALGESEFGGAIPIVAAALDQVVLALPATLLLTPAVQLLHRGGPTPTRLAWTSSHSAVFWRVLALTILRQTLLVATLAFAGVFPASGLGLAAIAYLSAALLLARLAPWLIGAALGHPERFGAAWHQWSWQVVPVVLGVVVPLGIAADALWNVLLFAGTAIEEHLIFLMLPFGRVLPFLATTLGVAAALAALAGRVDSDAASGALHQSGADA